MSIEKVNEVPFTLRRKQRSTLSRYWAIMGFLFEITRDIHPYAKVFIDTMTLLGLIYAARTSAALFTTILAGRLRLICSRDH